MRQRTHLSRPWSRFSGLVAILMLLSACSIINTSRSTPQPTGTTPATTTSPATAPPASSPASLAGIHKIQHVIVIMQENRSFDSYFGTYPGADGIPMQNGVPTVCVTDPANGRCVKPYLDHQDVNGGGPHEAVNSTADVDGGKMDGFLAQAEKGARGCLGATNPACTNSTVPDVLGYHSQSDIPNYWSYAQHFVLQDHLFESVHSWSFPSHLFLISGWSATCSQPDDPMSCQSQVDPRQPTAKDPTPYAWTDLTYLLNKNEVSWAWYLDRGAQPVQSTTAGDGGDVPKIWNVLPGFNDVHQDQQLGNIQQLSDYYTAAKNGSLPSVSWILPNDADSEHPPALVSTGQSYVTSVINAAMRSPDWDSTAIFVTWDDWGGFYDHVVPPAEDQLGYGIRVPGLLISPYSRVGYIDHQTLSFDAYLKFIEDDFLGGQRLNPQTDGRPDPRPVVREDVPQLGNLVNDFNFDQSPLKPMMLPVYPRTTLIAPVKKTRHAKAGPIR